MLVLRNQTISTFDIAKTKTVSGYLDAEDRCRAMVFPLLHSLNDSELGKIAVKKSFYNYDVHKDDVVFLWNTASDACVLLNSEEAENYRNAGKSCIASDFQLALYRMGFLVDADLDETFRIDLLRKKHAYSYPENGHVDIEILPTQTCNARCFYCFEQNYRCLTMDEHVIFDVVNYICSRVKPNQEVCFIWFGGEPLMGEHIIDEILGRVNDYYDGRLSYYSSITTNNSLIDEEIIKKFQNLWNVKDVLTTIDGYQGEHDARKAYTGKKFDAYGTTLNNLRILAENGFRTTCRINLDKENIAQLPLILDDLKLLQKFPNFQVQCTTLRSKTTQGPELEKYYASEEYAAFYHVVVPMLYEKGFVTDALTQLPVRDSSNCISCALNKVVINSNGKLFKCVQDSLADSDSVGDCVRGARSNLNYTKWYREIDNLGDQCEQCIFLPCCQGGCKYYRINPSFDTTPCFRKKFYIDLIVDRIIQQYGEEGKQCPTL